jgi:hypothetical protein
MSDEVFEITIEVGDPDAVVAWIRRNFPADVSHVTAFEIGMTERWRVRLIGQDPAVAAAIKLFWHNQDA